MTPPEDAALRHASLPMYDADRAAVGAWWRGIAAAMRAQGLAGVPDAPQWPAELDAHWREPRLLLSQTCGQPLATRLRGAVQAVGAFRYTAPGCRGIDYRSELVARDDDATGPAAGSQPMPSTDAGAGVVGFLAAFRGCTLAVNGLDSYSGHHALLALLAPGADASREPFFARRVVTGSHRASLAALHAGEADIAAIDCVTLAGLCRADAQALAGLRVIGHTAPAPGLPLITSRATPASDVAAIRRALTAACADPTLAAPRRALFIAGFTAAPASAWDRLL